MEYNETRSKTISRLMETVSEREAYEHWKAGMEPYGFGGLDAFQAGAAWQRTQAAVVQEAVYMMRRLDQTAWYVTTFQTFEHIASGKSPQHEAVKLYTAAPARQAVQDMVRAALSPENQRVVPAKPLLADPHPMAASPAQPEVQRLREVVSSLIDIAHEHRHELKQQRFSDNDEGDAFARHRDSRVGRIDRILQAALAASAGQEVES